MAKSNNPEARFFHFFLPFTDEDGNLELYPNFMWLPTFLYLQGGLQKIIITKLHRDFVEKFGRLPTTSGDDLSRLDVLAGAVLDHYLPFAGIPEFIRAFCALQYVESKASICGQRIKEATKELGVATEQLP